MRQRYIVGLMQGLCAAAAFALTLGLADPDHQQPAPSKPVESLLPADAAIYIGWEGTDAHKVAWEKTAAFEALQKSGFLSTLTKIALTYLSAKNNDKTPLLTEVVQRVARKGMSVAVRLPKESGGLQFLVVLHGAASLEPALRPMLIRIAADPGAADAQTVHGRKVNMNLERDDVDSQFAWWAEGEHLVIGSGDGVLEAALDIADGKAPNLASTATWKKRHENRGGFETAFFACVNEAGWKWIGSQEIHERPFVNWMDVFTVLGIDRLKLLTCRYGFRDRALQGEMNLELAAPGKEQPSLVKRRPISLSDLPPLPAKTSGFAAASFNFSQAFDTLVAAKKAVSERLPDGTTEVDALLAEAGQVLGFDVKKDFFDALGDVVCLYGDVSALPSPINMGLAIRVKDAEKLQRSVRSLVRVAQSEIADLSNITRENKLGREIYVVELGNSVPIRPTICVDKQWLFVGLSPLAVESALLRVDGKEACWKPSAAEQALLNGAPKEFLFSALYDPRPSYAGVKTLAPLAMPWLEGTVLPDWGSTHPGTIPSRRLTLFSELPAADALTGPLFSNIVTWAVDDRRHHLQWKESVPPLIATSAVAFRGALYLPSIEAFREDMLRRDSANNLFQIVQACHLYLGNNQSFPQGTHPHASLKPDKRISWLAELLPYLDQAALYSEIDFEKSWDDESNRIAVTTSVGPFLNPGISQKKTGDVVAHYVGLAGLGVDGPTLPVTSPKAGYFAYDRVTRQEDITDGVSNTAMISEASKDYGSWAAGGRPTIRSLTKKPYFNGPDGIGGPFRGGCNIAFADGSVRFVSTAIDPKVFEALVTIAGRETVDLSKIDAQ